MKKIISLIMCVLISGMMVLSSCSSENLFTAADDEITVTVNCDTPRGWDIAKYAVTATDSLGNVKSSESAAASLSLTLKKGVWSFVVSAYDATSTELYKGSKDSVDLTSGTATSLSVMIIKRAGSVLLDISAYSQAVEGTPTSISVAASKNGFDPVMKSAASFNDKVSFEDLAQGAWTFTVSADGKTVGTMTGNVAASALIKLTGTYTTTTTTTTTTTVGGGTTTTTVSTPVTGDYYWTNKDGHYGTNKTINTWADWTASEQIAQCGAYDDPRTWKGIQETAYDVYALYAAYDDTNLYLMAELVNLPDERATFMNHNYAGSDNAWWDNRDCPIGFILNTGKGVTANGPTLEKNAGAIWGGVDFTDASGFDWLLYHSSKYGFAGHKSSFVGVGTPGFFHVKSTGFFSYDSDYCLSVNKSNGATLADAGTAGTSGITIRYTRKCQVSTTIYFESTPTDNRATSGQTGADLMASTTYSSAQTNDLDMSYWYTIPLATLGIDKAYIQSHGIGVRQITPNGGSLMDCCPWDVSMVDNATDPCSDDESTSHEKEDVDNITSGQARIGK